MPEHDNAFHLVAEPGLAEQLTVGHHEVRPEVGTARDLGEQRPPALARELLCDRPGSRAGDDDRAGAGVDRRATRRVAVSGSRIARRSRAHLEIQPLRRHVERDHCRERLAVLEVQVHGTGTRMRHRLTSGVTAERRSDGVASEARYGIRLAVLTLGSGDVPLEPQGAREDARLHGGLVRTDATELRRPVG